MTGVAYPSVSSDLSTTCRLIESSLIRNARYTPVATGIVNYKGVDIRMQIYSSPSAWSGIAIGIRDGSIDNVQPVGYANPLDDYTKSDHTQRKLQIAQAIVKAMERAKGSRDEDTNLREVASSNRVFIQTIDDLMVENRDQDPITQH
jgi:hypothetical protein